MRNDLVIYCPELDSLIILQDKKAYKFKNEHGEFFSMYFFNDRPIKLYDFYLIGEL